MVLQASWPIAIESSPSHTRTAQHPLTNLLQVNMCTYNKLAYWQIMMNEKNSARDRRFIVGKINL